MLGVSYRYALEKPKITSGWYLSLSNETSISYSALVYSALVYSANSANVRHTIVDGKIIMQDRDMLTVDEDKIRQEALDFTKVVRKTVIESGEVVQ